MKKDKEKRKHHESTIGKIIYGFLLFLPLLAISITCGYAMFNKNAYQSYEGEFSNSIPHYTNTTFNVSANNNGNYNFVVQNVTLPQDTNIITISFNSETNVYNSGNNNISGYAVLGINLDSIKNTNLDNYNNNSKSLVFSTYYYENQGNGFTKIKFCFLDYEINTNVSLPQNLTWFEKENAFITFERSDDINIYGSHHGYYFRSEVSSGIKELMYYTIEVTKDLSNVFYYSVDKVEQSNLFNWAKTSMIYTGMLNFTTAMNVTNTFIPMLLTYWLIISVIYFLYDIILLILVVLHRKIHELQESI